jgi:hypothetical protein
VEPRPNADGWKSHSPKRETVRALSITPPPKLISAPRAHSGTRGHACSGKK